MAWQLTKQNGSKWLPLDRQWMAECTYHCLANPSSDHALETMFRNFLLCVHVYGTTEQYWAFWTAWPYALPRSIYSFFIPAQAECCDSLTHALMLLAHILSIYCDTLWCRVKGYDDCCSFSIKSTVPWWHIDESLESPVRWHWVRHDLKIRFFMAVLTNCAQHMVWVSIYSSSCSCTQRLSGKYYSTEPRDEGMPRTNRPLSVCNFQTRRNPYYLTPISFCILSLKYFGYMDDAICGWSLNDNCFIGMCALWAL